MSKVMPNPHLIVWTGDSVPHVDDTQYGTNGEFLLQGEASNTAHFAVISVIFIDVSSTCSDLDGF
jgi:hypothetical protein